MSNEEYVKEEDSSLPQSEKDAISEDIEKLKPSEVLKEKKEIAPEIKLGEKKEYSELTKEISASIREYITTYITLADTKAGFLLGITAGLLTTIYLYGPKIFEKALKSWTLLEFSTVIGSLLLIGSIYLSLLVVWPRIPTSKKKGFISWVHVE